MRTNRLAIFGAMAALAAPSFATREVMAIQPKPSVPLPSDMWLSASSIGGYRRKPSRTVAQDKRDALKAKNRRRK